MTTLRRFGLLDQIIGHLDQGLRTVFGAPAAARANPGEELPEAKLSDAQTRHVTGLMRVNHTGEVCAQALYEGQALTAHNTGVRDALNQAAKEETDHLAWCRQRIEELGGRTSRLDPLWYGGSFAIGAAAGLLGDRFSLGFLAETERQVVDHLEKHLDRLPHDDARSRAIVEQMRDDETEHATTALEHGGAELPGPVKTCMRCTARVMTRTAYFV